MSGFVHLHTHSHYSLLGAVPQVKPLVKRAKQYGMDALALTDNGNLYGAVEFSMVCEKEGLKPIIGVDAYLAPRGRKDMEHGVDEARARLLLLAENDVGYHHLIKLVTASYLEGLFGKPRMDREILERWHEGLIAVVPASYGEHVSALRGNDLERAGGILDWYTATFGSGNVFLELTHHPEIEGHAYVEEQIKALARTSGVPLLAAHDTYYLAPEDRLAREIMIRIQNGGDFEAEGFHEDEDRSFITPERAEELFAGEPEALAHTRAVADRCSVKIEIGHWYFPDFKIASGKTADDELYDLATKGAVWRGLAYEGAIKERIDYELKVIKDKGYGGYFLVVGDLLREARERGILTTIRGSVAGSLVTYVIGITNVDPLALNLPFERFLNPHRPSAPDIDMDYADTRRDEMIEYAKEKYGHENVAQIGTFGTMMARAVVRDVARALGYPYGVGDKVAKTIPFGSQGFPMTIDHALESEKEFATLYEKDKDVRRIVDIAKKIEGCARHVGVHAAGVVIAPAPLSEFVPIQPDPKGGGKYITQYDMHSVGEDGVGLLKFDFLGIKNLSILADAIGRVKERHGVSIDIENIPLDDTPTYEMLARGETGGVFQFNGAAMTRYLKELKPTKIEDLNAMIALYRPGPMKNIPEYIARKQGRAPVRYFHPKARKFLEPSYGILVYQDDLLFTALELAGYNWETVDKFRKAVGKKIPEEMAKQHVKFVEGCIEHSGMTKEAAEAIWALFEPFQGYGFNKCVAGDTLLYDAERGAQVSVRELYESRARCVTYGLAPDHRLSPMPVDAVVEQGVRDLVEVRLRSGRSVRVTENHPLRTFSGWTVASALTPGTRVAAARTLPEPTTPGEVPEHLMALAGYLIAEGNLCHPHGVYFYSTREDEVEDFVRLASKLENVALRIDRSKSAASVYVGQARQRQGNELMAFLRSLGLAGLRATEKHVPAQLTGVSNARLAALLGKLWQGDGCVSGANGQTFYATSSIRLARDVQHLLLRFNIQSTLHTKRFRYRGGLRTGYTVVVTRHENITRFNETIGRHLIGEKRRALTALVCAGGAAYSTTPFPTRGTVDTVPAAVRSLVRLEMARVGVGPRELARELAIAERTFYTDDGKRGYQRPLIGRIAARLHSPLLASYATSDVVWDEVVSVLPAGREMTYDVAVSPHHTFLANDIVTHNSHAASYGKVAYQTAYMKAHYPVEYMAAILTADSGDIEKVSEAVAECARMGIRVLKPDVNESFGSFTVVAKDGTDAIRFGLTSIKNFGEGVAQAIIDEREARGRFTSLSDFLTRIKDKNLNKKSLEALIMCGALDSFEYKRGRMLTHLEHLLTFSKDAARDAGQASLFGSVATLSLPDAEPAPITAMLRWEKELLGLYVSGHPLDAHREKLASLGRTITDTKHGYPGVDAVIAGILTEVKPLTTKKGDKMAFLSLADYSGSIEAVAFPKVFEEYRELLVPEACVAFKGKVNERNGERSFVVDKVKRL